MVTIQFNSARLLILSEFDRGAILGQVELHTLHEEVFVLLPRCILEGHVDVPFAMILIISLDQIRVDLGGHSCDYVAAT